MKTNTELLQKQMFEIHDLPWVNFEVEETKEPCLEIKWYDPFMNMEYLQVIMDYFKDNNPHIYSENEYKNHDYCNYFKIYIVDRRDELPF